MDEGRLERRSAGAADGIARGADGVSRGAGVPLSANFPNRRSNSVTESHASPRFQPLRICANFFMHRRSHRWGDGFATKGDRQKAGAVRQRKTNRVLRLRDYPWRMGWSSRGLRSLSVKRTNPCAVISGSCSGNSGSGKSPPMRSRPTVFR